MIRIIGIAHLKVLAVWLVLALVHGVNAAVGVVQFAAGDARSISRDGTARALTKGQDINEGDTLVTGRGGSM